MFMFLQFLHNIVCHHLAHFSLQSGSFELMGPLHVNMVVLSFPSFNPSKPKRDQHLVSPHSNTAESFIEIM